MGTKPNGGPKKTFQMSANRRVENIAQHLAAPSTSGSNVPKGTVSYNKARRPKSPNDVVIVSAVRSALTKGGKGGFRETHPEYILGSLLKAMIDQTGIDPKVVEDIQVGNVLMPGAGVTTTRMAALYAGYFIFIDSDFLIRHLLVQSIDNVPVVWLRVVPLLQQSKPDTLNAVSVQVWKV
jgi:hypothetical protein